MPDEGGVVLEALPAVGTLIRPLLSMSEIVLEKTGASLKPLPAFMTRIGPLPGVDSLVLFQG